MADNDAYEGRRKFVLWIMGWTMGAFIVMYLLMIVCIPIQAWIRTGINIDAVKAAGQFVIKAWHPTVLMDTYLQWIKAFKVAVSPHWSLYIPFFPFGVFFTVLAIGMAKNPYDSSPTFFGSGRLARYADIKKMGLFNGFVMVLGRFQGKLLKLPETLSTLVVAPPGTGKSVGVAIPTIYESNGLSLIINDVKPELCYDTSGYRDTIGPVFVINWGAEDDPEKGIFYPSWNPLSPTCIPPAGAARDIYIDSMVAVLIEVNDKDPHWGKTGRNAMTGFLQFITSKCERARAHDYFVAKLMENNLDAEDRAVLETYYTDMGDPEAYKAVEVLRKNELTMENYVPIGSWDGLPSTWQGQEPCIAMILDWLTETQMKIAADLKRRMDEGDQMAMMADPMRDALELAIEECNRFGYPRRAVTELNQLAGTPDKERGSILSTALTGIGIFKNGAVRNRTRFSDFTFRDIRGMRDPITGIMKPISVYLSINQVDARALNVITGIFVELMSSYLIANPPNFVGTDGKKSGPFPVLFVLDEFPQMPKLAAIKDGPAVGRGQKISYLLIGQDLGQISGKYGKDDLETIITTTAAKVILSQNNEQTAERFSKMIGTKTMELTSSSRQEGMTANKGQGMSSMFDFSKNVSRSYQSTSVVNSSDMLSLDSLKQYVLMQGHLSHPILADAPRWYLDKGMRKKHAIPACPFVPYWIVAQREETDLEALKVLMQGDLDSLDFEEEEV